MWRLYRLKGYNRHIFVVLYMQGISFRLFQLWKVLRKQQRYGR